MVTHRFDVVLVALDPTIGSEIRKTRPCAIVSPDEMNDHIATLIVAPMTTAGSAYPSRVPCAFAGKRGHIVLDQIRTIDKRRVVRVLGALSEGERASVLTTLAAMFAP